MSLKCAADFVNLKSPAPWRLQLDDFGALPAGDLRQPIPEEAVHACQQRVARLHQVGQRGFHGRRARTGDSQSQPVAGLKHQAQ
jgi:hypothetical protein